MKRRTSVREYIPVGRVSLLVIALACALAAWLLFHYQAPDIVILIMVLIALGQGLLALLALPPGRAYSFASRQDPRRAGSRATTEPRNEFSPPVSRMKLALFSALLGLSAGLVYWFDGPRDFVWILAVCAGIHVVVMLLPDRVRRLLAWDLGNW